MKNIVFRRMFVVIFTIVIGVVCAAGAAIAQQDNDTPYMFGFNERSNAWVIQKLLSGGKMGNKTNQGYLRNSYQALLPFSAGGKNYLFGFNKRRRSWFIQELLPGGKMGGTIVDGIWNKVYQTLVSFSDGEKSYLFGFTEDRNSWFIREFLPGGKIGNNTDKGRWKKAYQTLFPFAVGGNNYLFGFTEQDNSWVIQELLPGGKLGKTTDDGRWRNAYQALVPFTIGGKSYLLGFNERTNLWFIQELLAGGKMGRETDSGRWRNTYQTLNVFTSSSGKTYLFGLENSRNSWFIQQLLAGGKMGNETDNGYWNNFYPTVTFYSQQSARLNCENAVVLANRAPFQGNTKGAPANIDTYSCRSDWNEKGPEVVHTITTTIAGDITATLTNMSADLDLFIFDACDADRCIAHGGDRATYSNAPPGTYYIVVEGYKGSTGSYTLTVDIPTPRAPEQPPAAASQQIHSSGGGKKGDWGKETYCPDNTYAYAFRLRVEAPQNRGDDTALNDIELRCREPGSKATGEAIYSSYSERGDWGNWESCGSNEFLTSYGLRVQAPQGKGDDTGANDLTFGCRKYTSTKTEAKRYLTTSNGAQWGSWTPAGFCPPQTAICGLKTRVESNRGKKDDSALNDVMFSCCPVQKQRQTLAPTPTPKPKKKPTPRPKTPKPTPKPTPTPAVPVNQYVFIQARHSGKCLDVIGSSDHNGEQVIQWECTNRPNQQWKVESVDAEYYRITVRHSGKSLDVAGGSSGNGAPITQWKYQGQKNQQWIVEPLGGGYYRITARHSGKSLDVSGSNPGNGAPVNQFDYQGQAHQQWKLIPVK